MITENKNTENDNTQGNTMNKNLKDIDFDNSQDIPPINS